MARPRTPKGRAKEVVRRLAEEYPGSARDLCALDHHNAFELLAATILSAQTTDVRVNMVTPALFARYPTPEDLAAADPARGRGDHPLDRLLPEQDPSVIGHGPGRGRALRRRGAVGHGGPRDAARASGARRPTSCAASGSACPGCRSTPTSPGWPSRLGLTDETDPVKIEFALNAMVPPAERGALSLRLILHGRRVCVARTPACDDLRAGGPLSLVAPPPQTLRVRIAQRHLRPLAGGVC